MEQKHSPHYHDDKLLAKVAAFLSDFVYHLISTSLTLVESVELAAFFAT